MREALIGATGQAQEVEETLRRLERDTELLDRAALEFLTTAWNKSGEEVLPSGARTKAGLDSMHSGRHAQLAGDRVQVLTLARP